jgi:sugar porter (SP) family MFS transporter
MQGATAADNTTAPHEPVHLSRIISICAIAALGGFLFGYDSSVINGANTALRHQFQVTDGFMQGFMVSIALLGSAAGAFVGGRIADRYGRKRVMTVAALMFLIGSLGTAFPFGLVDFMGWRLVGGFGIGLAAVICPMYISEVAPAHLRGRLSSLFQFAIVIGIFSTQLVNQFLIVLTPDTPPPLAGDASVPPVEANNTLWLGIETWQWMFLCMLIPAIVYFFLALRVPESPRYLVAEGRSAEAEAVLQQIYVNDPHQKVVDIEQSLAGEHKPRLSDIKGPRFGLQALVWIGIILAVFQQFVGINAVFYYSNTIWAAVGFPTEKAFITSTIISLVNVVFTIVAITLVDRVGRKPLLLIGSAGMFVSLGILTWVFASAPVCTQAVINSAPTSGCTVPADINTPILSTSGGWIAVVMLNTYVAFFAATWGPVVWVLLGEMFPNKIRAAALSVGVMANWIANFIVTTAFPEMVKKSLGLAYGIFTVCALLSFFYVSKYVRETKGVELEDMDELESAAAS